MCFKKLIFTAIISLSMGMASAAVNINTATVQELDTLPGIGAAKAQSIVDYRTKNGPFKSVDELDKVKGIGPALLEKLKPEVTLSNPNNQKKATPIKPLK